MEKNMETLLQFVEKKGKHLGRQHGEKYGDPTVVSGKEN
jgi:hypothetical protein